MKHLVEDIMTLVTPNASIAREKDDILRVAKKIVEDPKTQTVYVIDEENKLVGMIPVVSLIQYLYYEYIPEDYVPYDLSVLTITHPTARDIMIPPLYVKSTEEISEVFKKMFENNCRELPVVDDEMHVIGDLNILEMIIAWIDNTKNTN